MVFIFTVNFQTMRCIISSLLILLLFNNTYAQKFNELALTPPMGWNSWNKFQCDSINEKVVREIADAMVSSGMKAAGYQYVVIDDCWQIDRDSAGFIIVDSTKFPSGMKALADYVHSKGLKFGIYSCAGVKTCARRPGSRGHEYQDAYTYAKWGVDYLKEDWCNTDGQNPKESYTLMRDALYKAGRPIVFSLCDWGLSSPWSWASDVGHLWRTTGDIANSWDKGYGENGKMWGGSVLMNLDMQRNLEKYAGPGHWNDPDMLEVGNGRLTQQEERAHFSLWCMLAAPLIAGNDLRHMTKETLAVLTNEEMIAIDQDKLGKQGYLIVDHSDYQVYMKPLSDGDTAICLFNRGDTIKSVTVNWAELRIGNNFKLRDVWKHSAAGTTATLFKANIPKHDVVVLRLSRL
jgi:alpha-galactosidase